MLFIVFIIIFLFFFFFGLGRCQRDRGALLHLDLVLAHLDQHVQGLDEDRQGFAGVAQFVALLPVLFIGRSVARGSLFRLGVFLRRRRTTFFIFFGLEVFIGALHSAPQQFESLQETGGQMIRFGRVDQEQGSQVAVELFDGLGFVQRQIFGDFGEILD